MMTSDAHCFHCGYDTQIGIGPTMSDPADHWPVCCRACARVTTCDYNDPELVCNLCWSTDVMPMADRRFWMGDGGDDAFDVGHFRCPKCGEAKLRFGTNAAGHPIILGD